MTTIRLPKTSPRPVWVLTKNGAPLATFGWVGRAMGYVKHSTGGSDRVWVSNDQNQWASVDSEGDDYAIHPVPHELRAITPPAAPDTTT